MQAIAKAPDVVEVGKLFGNMDPLRGTVFVFLVLFVIIVLERAFASWGMRQERKDMAAERKVMWATADKFTEAAKLTTSAADKIVLQLQVLQALAARVESNAPRN